MNIRPVSGMENFNNIHFTSRKNKNDNPPQTVESSNSTLAKVPLALLIAMSPVGANAQMEYPERMQDVKVEHFDKKHVSVNRKAKILSDGQSMIFTTLNNDKNKKNSEILGFKYRENDDKPEYKTGIIQAICKDKTYDDRYIITYRPTENDVPNYVRLCTVPKKFGKHILKFAKSLQNNDAVNIGSIYDFEEAFGISNVDGACPIEEIATQESHDKSWDNLIFLLDFKK